MKPSADQSLATFIASARVSARARRDSLRTTRPSRRCNSRAWISYRSLIDPVAVADLRPPDCTVAAVLDARGEAFGGVCDVTDAGSVGALVAEVLDCRDGIDGLVQLGTVFKGTPMWAHYVSSKGEVIAAPTRALARQFGPDGVRVNCVAPGLTLSEGVLGHTDRFPRELMDANVSGRCLPRAPTRDD